MEMLLVCFFNYGLFWPFGLWRENKLLQFFSIAQVLKKLQLPYCLKSVDDFYHGSQPWKFLFYFFTDTQLNAIVYHTELLRFP